MRKNIPDKVLKSFSRQIKARKSFSRQKSVRKFFLWQKRTCYQLIKIRQNLKLFLQSLWTKLLQYKKVRVLWSQFILLDILKTLKKHVWNCLTIQDNWRLSGNFFRIIKKFQDHLKNIQTIQKLSQLSGNCLDHPENIQAIQKLSRPSGNFPGYSKTFRNIRKYPAYPDTFQAIWKLSGPFGKYPDCRKTFQAIYISQQSAAHLASTSTKSLFTWPALSKLTSSTKIYHSSLRKYHQRWR